MHFGLTDEQRALQDAVRSYLADRFGQAEVRAVYEDPEGDANPEKLWQATAEQGWLGLMVPEENDGFGAGLLEAAVVARAFGAGTVPGPWLGTVLAAEAVRLAGSDAQKAAWLPRLAAGEAIGAVALLRPGSSPVPGAAGTDGVYELVEYGHLADVLVVATGAGQLALVEKDGFTAERLEALDRTSRLARVTVSGSGEALEAASPKVHQQLLDRGAVLVANDLVGIARKALTDTVNYDKDRVQFGKPVGSFQAIKHTLADLHVAVTMAEHACLYAAFAVDTDREDATLAVSIAKSKAGDVARKATSDMIQYHGGIGYTWEHDAHFYFKRAKREEYLFGDAAQHRERIAKILIDGATGSSLVNEPGGTATAQGTGVSAGAAL